MADSPITLIRARHLRKNNTDAERRMWRMLRSRQLAQMKFRRQHPVHPFIVDFVCLKRRLVIEVDGGQHAIAVEADARRTRYLEDHGFRVVRFWCNDVLSNTEGVYEAILREVAKAPHPGPLPTGERGKSQNRPVILP